MSDPGSRSHTELLGRLLGPAAAELTCEACFDQLDRYVEVELGAAAGADAATVADAAVPGMRAHLEGCPACAEDHDSLLALLRSERR